MAVVTKNKFTNVSSGKAKPAWYVYYLISMTPCSCPLPVLAWVSRAAALTRLCSSLTERCLSGVEEGSSRLDNWLSESPLITDLIAFHLPSRRTLPQKSTNAGLGKLDNTNAPNWARTPDQQWNMGPISINLKYRDY